VIKAKKKICKTCNNEDYLWARGECKRCASKSKPAKIKPVSDKRAQEQKSYSVMRRLYLEANPECACGGIIEGCDGQATEVHHARGRVGELYLDIRYWKPLTSSCHKFVELNPVWAKENGLSENRL